MEHGQGDENGSQYVQLPTSLFCLPVHCLCHWDRFSDSIFLVSFVLRLLFFTKCACARLDFLFFSVLQQRFQTNVVWWPMAIVVFQQLFNIHRSTRLLPSRQFHVKPRIKSILRSKFVPTVSSWFFWVGFVKR